MMHIKFQNFTDLAKNMATNLFPKRRPPVFGIWVYIVVVFTIHHIVNLHQRSGEGNVFSRVCLSVILSTVGERTHDGEPKPCPNPLLLSAVAHPSVQGSTSPKHVHTCS